MKRHHKRETIIKLSSQNAAIRATYLALLAALLSLSSCGNESATDQVEAKLDAGAQDVAPQAQVQEEIQLATEFQAQSVDIYNTLGSAEQQPLGERTDVFECESTVYTVIELRGANVGTHQLEVDWFDPSQSKRETTRYNFNVVSGQERIWAWLRLHRASGAGMMKWLDSSAGLEEFVGNWLVEVKIDGRNIGQTSFRVIC